MPTHTFYAEESDDALLMDAGSYAAARAGPGSPQGGSLLSFQSLIPGPTRRCTMSMIRFNSSSIGAGPVVSAGRLNLETSGIDNLAGIVAQARIHPHGATVDSGDWVADPSTKTLVAHKAAGALVADTRYDFDDDALAANINKTGYTEIMLVEKDQADNVDPSTNHFLSFKNANNGGTTSDPRLEADTVPQYIELEGSLDAGAVLAVSDLTGFTNLEGSLDAGAIVGASDLTFGPYADLNGSLDAGAVLSASELTVSLPRLGLVIDRNLVVGQRRIVRAPGGGIAIY